MKWTNLFAMALVGFGAVFSSCNRDDQQATATQTQANNATSTPPAFASPKYSDGQRVKLGDETIVVLSHRCEPEPTCRYDVYFLSDSERAAKEGRQTRDAWVKESELGSVVAAFEVGQRVYFIAEPLSIGYVTHTTCNSGRCRYAVSYVDKNGVHRETFAEEFELLPCFDGLSSKCK